MMKQRLPLSEGKKVVIIGAGPAGSIAATLLQQQGHQTVILEKEQFPRFCIGESLLPQCMEFIEQAGMLPAINDAGFQLKTGATFLHHERISEFCFSEQFSSGFGFTYQVQRDRFDTLLAAEAQRQGAVIHWRHQVTGADFSAEKALLTVLDEQRSSYRLEADFVLDASGFGRVLPGLLNLGKPSGFPVRQALFTHIEDRICCRSYDRNKIRIIVHPEHPEIWYWLIPFSNGRCSLGIVSEPTFLAQSNKSDRNDVFHGLIEQEPTLSALLKNACFDTPIGSIEGYSANVSSLYGNGYALLGNAGEFLDPVFSSGVTIAMKSASLAAAILNKQFQGQAVNWERDFADPLQQGVDVFRTYVTAWYNGELQDVIFYPQQQANIKAMICSILAGYVWDKTNPYVKQPQTRLNTLVELCRTTA